MAERLQQADRQFFSPARLSLLYVREMDNNFKFKTRHVSIVQRSSSVVNSFTSSVDLIQAGAYKVKRATIRNFEKLKENLKRVRHSFFMYFYCAMKDV